VRGPRESEVRASALALSACQDDHMTIDMAAVREDTPGSRDRIHFNNAGASLMPRPVVETVVRHLELEARIGGYEAAEAERERIAAVYRSSARLINCEPEEIALLENATRAWDAAFYSIRFATGDRIVTGRAEYCSNYMAFLQVARAKGAEIVVIGDDAHGQIDVDELRERIDDRVKLISVTHVPTSGGLVNPAAEVGRVAREAGVLYLLDATQSVGQMPIDIAAIGCDFLATTGRKFIRAPRGTGLLYVSRSRIPELHPPVVEVGGASWTERDGYTLKDDAKRFETWEASYALQLGLGQAIDYALDLGIEAIWERVRTLGDLLRRELTAIDGISVHDLGLTKCGIVTFTASGVSAELLARGLAAQAINVDISKPDDTRLDFEARNLEPMIRASVHYFNTEDEIGRSCALVEEIQANQRSV
jgi:cysteine desulfurase / selenocysteine lyase